MLAVFFGWEHRSKLVANLSFLGYNRGLEGRTPQDWLNRDQAEVDKYRADERCMFTFTLNAYYSMFTGILRLYDPAVLAGVPKDLPLLFLAGDADPVGERTAGVQRAIQSLRDAGVGNIESKFYPAPATSCWWRRTKPKCLRTSPTGSTGTSDTKRKAPRRAAEEAIGGALLFSALIFGRGFHPRQPQGPCPGGPGF